MKKKLLSVVCALTVCTSLMAGCGKPKTTGSANSSGGKVTVKMAVSGSAQEIDIRKKTAELYMKKKPNIKIEWVDIGNERFQKTLTLISSGSAPDILYINEYVFAFAEKGVLEPLDDIIAKDNEFKISDFYESLLEPLRWNGKLYGLPQEVSPFVIYYNKDMFNKAGVPLPADSWTREQFLDAAKKLTNETDKVYGYRHHAGGWYDQSLQWMIQDGVKLYSDDLKSTGFDSPETLKSLNFLRDMVVTEKVSPSPASIQAMGKGFDAMFRNQKVAMEAAGLWMLPQYDADKLPFDWDVVRVPVGADNQQTKAGVLNWSISKSSKVKEQAWDVLKFFVGEEAMKIVAESRMAMPATKLAQANDILLKSSLPPKNMQAFIDSAPDVNLTDQMSSKRNELFDAVGKELDSMLNGKQTPEETQKKMVEVGKKILGK
jgi:multiple sugar transport system substrate-binding protein